MIRISKKEASEQLQYLKESYGIDPIYIDEKSAKAFECLELFINQTLLDRKPLPQEEKNKIEALLNSCIDGWEYATNKERDKRYKKLKKEDGEDEFIYRTRIVSSFLLFMMSHGVDEFINYLECTDFFKNI